MGFRTELGRVPEGVQSGCWGCHLVLFVLGRRRLGLGWLGSGEHFLVAVEVNGLG